MKGREQAKGDWGGRNTDKVNIIGDQTRPNYSDADRDRPSSLAPRYKVASPGVIFPCLGGFKTEGVKKNAKGKRGGKICTERNNGVAGNR